MAKKARANGVNKSAAVREYLKANSESKPKQAAEELSKQLGMEITPAFVSQVKVLVKKKAGKPAGRRGRRPAVASTNGSSPSSDSSMGSIAAAIRAGRELLAASGSAAEAHAVIKALAG